jgi:hypothetical protein
MADVGRNEPCPCGSGKKFKKCCAQAEVVQIPPETRRALALHRGDAQLADEMLRWARKRHGKGWLQEAFDTYFDEFDEGDYEMQLFVPWAVYHFETDGKTLAREFAEARRSRLSADAGEWLGAQARSWLSVWEVLEVSPGEGIRARDLLTFEERFVHEVKASKVLKPRHNVLGRVVDCAGVSTFRGMHPRALSPAEADVVVEGARDVCEVQSGAVPVEMLRDMDTTLELIDGWHACVEEQDRPKPLPRMQNTDGDPLLLTKDHFDFSSASRSLVLEKLQALDGAEDLVDEDGEAEISFAKPGNAQIKSWDKTLVGRALVGSSRLTMETNSTRRADELRKRLEDGLGGLVQHRVREHLDLEPLLKAMPPGGRHREPPPPELQAVVRDFKEKHMAQWLEEKIPALDGLTPIEAIDRPESRAKLDLLLRDLEHRESRLPPEERFDFHHIREQLRMPQ